MPQSGSTLKSTPSKSGAMDMSSASVEMLESEKETATRPVRFSKLASNSCLNVLLSNWALAASTSSAGTLPPSIVVKLQRFQSPVSSSGT